MLANSKLVIQLCPTCGARDQSRGAVTPPHYTQMVMTDLATDPSEASSLTVGPTGQQPRSAPAAGRPFTTEASRWSAGVLHAEELILVGLGSAVPTTPLSDPGPAARGQASMSAIHRAARRLIAAWLAGVLMEDFDYTASLREAELWFTGSGSVTSALPLDAARHAHAVLEALACRDGALEMLPYALDPIPHEYRRDILQNTSAGAARAARKERGSFFTPTDVVDHIVDVALNHVDVHKPGLRLLDPAGGTGVFLRSAFAALLRRGLQPIDALRALHAIDVDECCVDMAAFVLLVDYRRASGVRHTGSAMEIWSEIRRQLLAADTLLVLRGTGREATLFEDPTAPSAHWVARPFDVIVGNPPYARLGERTDLSELRSRYQVFERATPASDLYPAFVELLCSSIKPGGAGSLVVPMSLGYSTTQQVRCVRELATRTGGAWGFEFFDRTPDALFGDDVKQRTAIVTRHATSSYSVVTSPVMRWTSRNRSGLFDRVPRVTVGCLDIGPGVPKLGSPDQAVTYMRLREQSRTLGSELLSCQRVTAPLDDRGPATVYVAGTAYNWLNIYRTADSVARGVEKPTSSPLLALETPSAFTADGLYALLSSRLVYWLWRVESDAFHVPSSWVAALPLSLDAFPGIAATRLASLGRALWDAVVEHPIVSVNGGRTTFSYCPHSEPELLDCIDAEILRRLDLPAAFGLELANFVRELTIAGRDTTTEHGLRRALASWRED